MNRLQTVSFITSFEIFLQFSIGVNSAMRSCCETGLFFRSNRSCLNGSMSISCSGYQMTFHDDEDFLEKYRFVINGEEAYLQNYETEATSIIPSDRVCSTDEMKNILIGRTNMTAISPLYILCIDYQVRHKAKESLETTAAAIISIISSVLLAITAFIYFIIPQTQDGEGKCIFNLALTLSFCHFWFPYKNLVEDVGIFSNFCITQLYLLVYAVLSAFLWSSLLSYHMWRRLRENVRLDESKLMSRYQLIGYGFPGLLIFLAYVHVHLVSLYQKSSLQWQCSEHAVVLIVLYTLAPWIIIESANAFFFVHLQRLLWNVHLPNSQEESTSFLKKVQFKLKISLRLFITMGLPWWIIVFCTILDIWAHIQFAFHIATFMFLIVCSEGIFIFCIMVVGRKRVRQGVFDKFGIKKFQPSSDMETSEEMSIADRNDDGQELQNHISRHIENGK